MTTCAEQIMNTYGGYQDAIGACGNGFKLIKFSPGIFPNIIYESIPINKKIQRQIQNRIIFVYTGKTRVAKNILCNIMKNYINKDYNTISALESIGYTALDMKDNLIAGNLKSFSSNMKKSFDLSILLNKDFTNQNINNILNFFANFSDGYMLSGAGNGGFITLLLKDSIDKNHIINLFNKSFCGTDISLYNFNLIF